MQRYGVFCLEGKWWGDLRDKASVKHGLQMISDTHRSHFDFIHQRIETYEELDHYLRVWGQRRYAKYPILYLAFHGEEACLCVNRKNIHLRSLKPSIAECRHPGLIHFGCCDILGTDARILKSFMRGTEIIALTGFKQYVDWFDSMAFEILLLRALEELPLLTRRKLRGVDGRLKQHFKRSQFYADLGFRIITNH